ncbi:MAG: ribosome silencing factor [Nitrosomonas sp.]|nr:ribosome silencing factor [Nitrosomonas sp.]
MDSKTLVKITVDALEDIKASDIKVLDVAKLTSMFDYVIIASASSSRQTKALANNVREKVKEAGGAILCFEGEQTGEWLLVDLGDVIVHIMQPEAREYYNLEGLWTE